MDLYSPAVGTDDLRITSEGSTMYFTTIENGATVTYSLYSQKSIGNFVDLTIQRDVSKTVTKTRFTDE